MTDDPDAVARDHELIEQSRRGQPTGDPTVDRLAAWAARVHAEPSPDPAPIYRELSDYHGYDVPEQGDGHDPATSLLPAVERRGVVEYAGHTDVVLGDEDPRPDGWCEDRSPELGELTRRDFED